MNNWDEITGELPALFALSRDAVLGLRRGRVVFANAAAGRLFGREVRGERLNALLPELNAELCRENGVTAVTVGGQQHTISVVVQGELRILTIMREAASPGPANAALLSRMRSAAFQLRFSLDRLTSAQAENENVRVAYHSYYSLQHLIGQLADANALSRGELATDKQLLDLAALVRDLTDSAAFFSRDRGVEITCRIGPGSHWVRGDRDRLEQLVLILLANGLTYTPSGGRIRVSLEQTAKQLILSVDDTGEGMDGAALSYAFTPRADADPAAASRGSGLGLYIAYELARAHGGAIVLQSEPGKGTRVRVTLPRSGELMIRDAGPAYARGPDRILTELSDVLSAEAYDPKYRH